MFKNAHCFVDSSICHQIYNICCKLSYSCLSPVRMWNVIFLLYICTDVDGVCMAWAYSKNLHDPPTTRRRLYILVFVYVYMSMSLYTYFKSLYMYIYWEIRDFFITFKHYNFISGASQKIQINFKNIDVLS